MSKTQQESTNQWVEQLTVTVDSEENHFDKNYVFSIVDKILLISDPEGKNVAAFSKWSKVKYEKKSYMKHPPSF